MSWKIPRTEAKIKDTQELGFKNYEFHSKKSDYAISELNKIIFILGTGTLVLSISFIGYLKTEILSPWLLIMSWICFIGAIACNIFAHLLTFKASNKRMEAINKSFESGFTVSWDIENNTELVRWRKWVGQINWVVFAFLGLGMLFLLIFGARNLLEQNYLLQQQNTQSILKALPS